MTRYTIGVIDDDPTIRELLQTFLEREGYAVHTASSSVEALALVKSRQFDALLMDIEIGSDSGIELLPKIRALDAYAMTPILCITGQNFPEILQQAFNAGADDFIGKPINLMILMARLKLQLQRTDYFLKLERARQMLKRYLSPRVANIAEAYSEGGEVPPAEERQVAICFTDIRDFTARAETMDPVGLFDSLSGHLRSQVELVYRHEGYVDKFNGDGLMAIFDGPNMVRQSCLCALSIMREAALRNVGEEKFPIGIGIHTGRVVLGNIGSPEHLDYSAIGQAVNLAARLCGYAKPETIVVSGAVKESIGSDTELEFYNPRDVQVRGVSDPVQIFQLSLKKGAATSKQSTL